MILPKAKTPGRRKLQIYDDTVGKRMRPSCRNRLRADIEAKGGYDYVWDVLNSPVSYTIFFQLGYRKYFREDVLQKFAKFMHPGGDPNYYIEEEVVRSSSFNIPVDRVRRMIECQIVIGELEPYSLAADGTKIATNLFEAAETLLEKMVEYGYPIGASLAHEVVGDLIRDGFAIRNESTGIVRIASLSLADLEETNRGRLGFEWSYHEAIIDRIGSGDSELKRHISLGFENALADCERLVGKGKQFSKADRAWHMVVVPPSCRVLAEQLMKACERPYMKKRRLLKSYYGQGDSKYVSSIERFNKKQLETLRLIVEEYRRTKPRKTRILELLSDHTALQIKAWDDCEDLVQAIIERGDKPSLGS